MSYDVHQRIDDFARRLDALNAEFEELKRVTVAPPEPVAPARPEAPLWLRRVDDLFAAGEDAAALREADRLRARALAASSVAQLSQLLAYLRDVETTHGTERARLLFTLEASIRFAREPRRAATPPGPQPERPVDTPRPPQMPALPKVELPRVELADLLGPRALAIAGGIVTLLGILFFFVLAVDRGWIGPSLRVALGGIAAGIVFGAGHLLRRKYGTTHAALAAVGTGIAGGYATLLSAASLYDLIPDGVALLGAAGIAAVGLVTALLWRSQLVAGLGLIGAILVPVALISQGSLSPLGTAFAAAVFVAAAVVGIRMAWREVLIAAGVATAGQLVGLIADPQWRFQAPASVLAVVAFVSLAFLGAGIAKQLRSKKDGLDTLASWFSISGAGLAVAGVSVLFATDTQRGVAFLAIVAVYAAAGAVFFLRAATRDLSALLTFVTFSLGAVAVAELLTGQPLAYAWAAEAVGLSWLARRVREPRYQAWSFIYLLLALGHVLAIDARPAQLFRPVADASSGAPAALAVAAAAAVCAAYARAWTVEVGGTSVIAALTRFWMSLQPGLRRVGAWAAATVAVYAASLWTVGLPDTYGWGWVAVAGLWMVVGVAFLTGAILRPALAAEVGSLIWLGSAAALAVVRSLALAPEPRAWTVLIVAFGLGAASLAYQLADRAPGGRRMDISAALAAAATILSAFGAAALLTPEPQAYVWAAEAVLLAVLAWKLAAPHLRVLSIFVLGLAAAETLARTAIPRQLLESSATPARGVVTAVAVALAAALTALIPAGRPRTYGALAAAAEAFRGGRALVKNALLWTAAAFATYAASLGLMALFPSVEWGTVAVAGLWMSVGLATFAGGRRVGSLVWLALTGALAVEQAARLLGPEPRAWAFAIVGVAGLAVSVAESLRKRSITAITGMTAALALFVYPVATLLEGRTQGAALLGIAGLWALIAAALFVRRSRDLGTLYAAIAVGLSAIADAELLHGTYAVLGWAAAGAALAWLAARVREPRLFGGVGVYLALALGRAVALQAPPTHLFSKLPHPAYGAASLFIATAALGAAAYFARGELGKFRALPWWLGGGLSVYGLSLVILELVERVHAPSLDAAFQRGQTGVSAFWGLLGLVLLYVGLKRRWKAIRLSGLALFPVVLAKIFFFDLPSLSSVTRAFSFLAVGFVLLLGGFFYQRMNSERGSVEPS